MSIVEHMFPINWTEKRSESFSEGFLPYFITDRGKGGMERRGGIEKTGPRDQGKAHPSQEPVIFSSARNDHYSLSSHLLSSHT